MDCESARAEVSSLLDHETVADQGALTAHLSQCTRCTDWVLAARELAEQSAQMYRDVPDLTEPLLRAITEQETKDRARISAVRAGRAKILRWAVGVTAIVQLVLAVPALLTVVGFVNEFAVHTSREMASFDIAVAVGFLVAALRPERARAFIPVAFVLAACLAGTSMFDIAAGFTSTADEAGHLIAVLQACFLWALSRHQDSDTASRATVTAHG